MIKTLELKNFTAFDNLTVKFSPKINILIGENGTGKTHLLKAAYTLGVGASLLKNKINIENNDFERLMTTEFIRIFLPLYNELGQMHKFSSLDKAEIKGNFSNNSDLLFSFAKDAKIINLEKKDDFSNYDHEIVFIGSKEIISMMLGFASLYEKYELSFDKTYHTLCSFLDLPRFRRENLHEKAVWAMEEIERVCGGKFIFYGGGNVTFKTYDNEYSANAVPEGFRKLGVLARLIETGIIQPGRGGTLFWDEPETNLNPQLLKLLVQILIEFSRTGVQIILATHNYVLLKWFELLLDKDKNDEIYFHSLYREVNNTKLQNSMTEDYNLIKNNPIDVAYGAILDQEIEKSMGGLGK